MKQTTEAKNILAQIDAKTKQGDLRKMAKEIKKDQELAMELWATGLFLPRQLAILIMDSKLLSQPLVDKLTAAMQTHSLTERTQLMDWLMANQLTKDKKGVSLIQSWKNSHLALQRRTYWYYQARLRWTGQTPPANSEALLTAIEAELANEVPEVQWAMNFTAGWIGVYEKRYRHRCIDIGDKTGLYEGDMVSRGCTPNYLPEFIAIESNKRNL
ncbi:DNA alkylation repair protein [Sphingobacterium griseoflavum]|uniref:DNA alkylation repair protein n=1 Tax=Sphingobacterium griseoflavum TaxID=1474952 RepID=A0ABQ3HXF6_9SPHI|nr:DNA alkylation repair protein [Sphingobacterium griseoflavum]GHE44430.1 DNA alkylation repair protein [Sphingobacterium griseoflavum]